MRVGKVVEWNDDRGFGFILPGDGGRKVFFHISNFPQRHGRPSVGQECFFETVQSDRGEKAVDIVTMSAEPTALYEADDSADEGSQRGWAVLIFLAVVAILAVAGRVPPAVPAAYVAASLLAMTVYKYDKYKARKGQWRVSEGTLHLLSLIGGWPGALIAQQRYRHKTRKMEFRAVFWFTVTVNCTLLVLLSLHGIVW